MALGAGPEGSPDNQKVQNWDGPQLGEVAASTEVAQTLGPFNVGRYGYLNLDATAGLVPALLILEWAQSKASMPKLPTEARWQRRFVVDTAVNAGSALLRIANLGPWVRVRYAPIGGAAQMTLRVGVSNRYAPWEVQPTHGIIGEGPNVFAGAGNLAVQALTYWAGPMKVFVGSSAAVAASVTIQAETEAGVFGTVDRVTAPASGQTFGTVQAPFGAWRFFLEALGATTVTWRAIPCLTGSS